MTTYQQALENLISAGFSVRCGAPPIAIEKARENLFEAAKTLCQQRGQTFVWHEEYEKVAEWLSDNRERGLMLMGAPGNGKTLMLDAIALVVYAHRRIIFTKAAATDIRTAAQADALLNARYSYLDDIGTESEIVDYGTRKTLVAEYADAIERHGHLALISTNLDGQALCERYGERTIDRLRGSFRVVVFKGNSHRK